MKKTLLTGLIATATIAAVGIATLTPAFARGEGGPHGPRINFEQMDMNGDGLITAEEMGQHRAAQFAAQDTDGDGFLSSQELVAAAVERAKRFSGKRVERMLKNRDTDGDGQLSMAEMTPDEGRANKFFERLDADGDGAISQDELDAMKKKFGKRKFRKAAEE